MREGFVFRSMAYLTLAGGLSACSLFQVEPGEQLPAGAFRGTAAIRNQTVPLPVEIASDIEQITAEGEVKTEKAPDSKKIAQIPNSKEAPETGTKQTAENKDIEKKDQTSSPRSNQPVVQMRNHPLSGRKAFSRKVASVGKGKGAENYKIRRGDTLMKISFAKYGDIYRWREIFEANREVLKDYNRIPIGAVIVIHGVEFVVIEKNGEPYLIRRGDTLGRIAGQLYGDRTKWRVLWQNNRKLIRNPNRIYAGFTIYYPSAGVQDQSPRGPARESAD